MAYRIIMTGFIFIGVVLRRIFEEFISRLTLERLKKLA